MYNLNQFIIHKRDETKAPLMSVTEPKQWLSYEYAKMMAGEQYGIGFVFTETDPYFFIDIDKALVNGQWSNTAQAVCSMFPGAYVEISQSGTGLHIIGCTTSKKLHSCRNADFKLELYTEKRYCALTGINAQGDPDSDHTNSFELFAEMYFPPRSGTVDNMWRTEPREEWNGYADDEQLLTAALKSSSAASVFGNSVKFSYLWECDEDKLSVAFPPNSNDVFNRSSADMALAGMLMFWTGDDHARTQRLMCLSGLYRDKYQREDYLRSTILQATKGAGNVYRSIAKIKGADSEQAEQIRQSKLKNANPNEYKLLSSMGVTLNSQFWFDNAHKTPEEIYNSIKPAEGNDELVDKSRMVEGNGYLGISGQVELFAGCYYVRDLHKIFSTKYGMLSPDQFSATYGGYIFLLDADGNKTTRRAWEAFTNCISYRFPQAAATTFNPQAKLGDMIKDRVNTYDPKHEGTVTPGDVTPFLTHLQKLLPIDRDRKILLSYLAACVQHKGTKFQWAPVLQGVQGNGKTLITRCMSHALGGPYVHTANAHNLSNKFNGWLMDKTFISVEDVYVGRGKMDIMEILKPMITNNTIEIEMKGCDQVTRKICANFLFNSNHKDAIVKSQTDRRYCVLYSAQQTTDDLKSSGMTGDYFPLLYKWLDNGGYEIVANFLHTYKILDEFNPAGVCQRAPETSSTEEAIRTGYSPVQEYLLECIDDSAIGLRGGWISLTMAKKLLGATKWKDISRRKLALIIGEMGYIRHPHLNGGRTNNPTETDGAKVILFVERSHPSTKTKKAAIIMKTYDAAQKSEGNGTQKHILPFTSPGNPR